jgi:hypothetical protein
MKQLFVGLALALASVVAVAAPADLTFCTGGATGAYESLGKGIGGDIAKKTGAKLDVINTGGSVENAKMMKDGDCVMAVMQADAVTSLGLPRDITVTNAHTEVVFWIHGKTGVKTFSKMTAKENLTRAVAYVSGSGAEVTLKNFGQVDSDYADIKTVEFTDWLAAAEAVAQGFTMKSGVRIEIGGMIYVGRSGLISSDITDDYKDQLWIGEIGESSFAGAKDRNENPLYTAFKISKSGDTGIPSDNSVFSIDTYSMQAQIVYNNSYTDGLPEKEAREVKRAVTKAITANVKAVRQ